MGIFRKFYDYKLLQKYSVLFGSLFDDFEIVRKSNSGVEQERVIVPINHSNKEKFIQRITQDPDLLRKEGITLPRFAFERVELTRNESRQLAPIRILGIQGDDPNKKLAFFNPIAYDMVFNLYIATKTLTDAEQIVEQILPAFKPDYVPSMRLIDEYNNFKLDVPISLVSNNLIDTYEGDISEKRTIVWTLTFVMNGFLLGASKERPLIKEILLQVQDISQIDVVDVEQINLQQLRIIPVVEGKLLSEIYETDDWDVETIFL